MERLIDLKNTQIYVISLKDDYERLKSFNKWCDELGFLKPILIPGIKDKDYYVGLAKSHYKALIIGLKSKKPFIIMEDDSFPNYNEESYIISIPENSDAVYLGASNYGVNKDDPNSKEYPKAVFVKYENYDNVFKIINTLTTHAILYIKEEYIVSVIKEVWKCFNTEKGHIDLAIASRLLDKNNVYFIKPFFYQNDKNKLWVLEDTKSIILA